MYTLGQVKKLQCAVAVFIEAYKRYETLVHYLMALLCEIVLYYQLGDARAVMYTSCLFYTYLHVKMDGHYGC